MFLRASASRLSMTFLIFSDDAFCFSEAYETQGRGEAEGGDLGLHDPVVDLEELHVDVEVGVCRVVVDVGDLSEERVPCGGWGWSCRPWSTS
jgi:hypothetical protein